VKKLKFHASLPPAQQLTSYSSLGDMMTRPIREKVRFMNMPIREKGRGVHHGHVL
jgi:hypothetical protein